MKKMFTPRKMLGKTGFCATALGIGDIADRSVPASTCVAILRRALDAGLNVIDTAPSYEDGYSEEIVGQAVRGVRQEVFVIDKIDHFDRSVEPQVRESLRRLDMACVDLMVFHGVADRSTWQTLTAPAGRMEELEECRAAGRLLAEKALEATG